MIKYKDLRGKWHQAVYLYNVFIGQVFNMKQQGWTAVPECTDARPKSICADGFKTKRRAVDFLLNWQEPREQLNFNGTRRVMHGKKQAVS
jgi:hypothetical protein